MYAGDADEIAEHSQEEPDQINVGSENEIAEHSQETADKVNVCKWC
jgi:hypothetical protein